MDSTNNSRFFQGAYKHAWKASIPQGLSEAEADFIHEMGELKEGSTVLDIMCGYGRHALQLARRGARVTAIDNLKDYIEEISYQASTEGLVVETVLADVLDVELEGYYDAVICMGNSFNFFSPNDALSLLAKISAHLTQGGTLILNSWSIAEIALKYFKDKDWHYEGEYQCVIENTYRLMPSRIEFEQTTISKDNKIEKRSGVDYIFSINEIAAMFAASGIMLTAAFSTPRKRKFVLGDTQAYLVGKKQ